MSDNQVTEPIETACFCKHGNLGQHESDCPKCPLHFTRGELNALQRERDQLRADMAKVRDENATLTAELEQASDALKQWHSSFFWRQSPDNKGFHMVEDKVIQRCLILTCAALARLAAKTEK